MQDGTIVSKDLKYITDDVYNQIQNYTIGKDDLYLTIVGSTIGKAGLVPKMFDNMNLTENAVKLTNIPINKYFLLYYVRSGYAQSQFRDNTKQVGQPKLAIFRIANTLVPIPPFAEQTKIVSKIEYTLHLVNHFSNLQEQLHDIDTDIYRDLKKSILQEAIQGKLVPQIAEEGTAKELLELIKAEKQKLVKEGKLKKSALNDSIIFRGDDNKYYEQVGKKCEDITEQIPFEIPKSWQWIRFDQGISLLSGRDLEPSRYNDLHHGIPYITGASNFVNSDLLVNRWTDSPITISDKGDLLLTCKGTIGSMAFNNIGQIHIARQVMAITSFGIDLKYIKCFLQSNLSILEKNANSIIPGISRNTLLDMLFPLPPIKEQQRIVAQIEKLFEQLR